MWWSWRRGIRTARVVTAEGGEELRVPSLPFPPYPSIRLSFPLYRHIAKQRRALATRARGAAEQRDSHDENRELLRQYAALVPPVSAASAAPYTVAPLSPEGVLDRC